MLVTARSKTIRGVYFTAQLTPLLMTVLFNCAVADARSGELTSTAAEPQIEQYQGIGKNNSDAATQPPSANCPANTNIDVHAAVLQKTSAVTVNQHYLSADTLAYHSNFRNQDADWVGSLTSYNISTTPPTAGLNFRIPELRAKIYSFNGNAQIDFSNDPFVFDAIKRSLQCPSTCTNDYVNAVIDYLAGDISQQTSFDGVFRDRSNLLGDIIHSIPAFISAPNFSYQDSPQNNTGTASYQEFKRSYKNRPELVIVGANDGMLHVFNAANGNEVMAYIPRILLAKLKLLIAPTYQHSYFVDGSPTVGDAFYEGAWHTVVVSGLNYGAQGVFGLDLTDTQNFSAIQPWEFTDQDEKNMGYSFSQPAIVLMSNGKWAAVFGNGYASHEVDENTGDGNAVLYIVYLGVGTDGFSKTGEFEVINTNVIDQQQGGKNGLSTVAPVDSDGDNIIDLIYAGDLNGNLWKFDVSSSAVSTWKSENNISKLYRSCDSLPCPHAITSRPAVGRGPKTNSIMVYFGTGKLLDYDDLNNKVVQSFYAIFDTKNNRDTVTSTQLVKQEILAQSDSFNFPENKFNETDSTISPGNFRVISQNKVNYGGFSAKKGWYLDLAYEGNSRGEQIITNPQLRNGRIIITSNTFISNADPQKNNCETTHNLENAAGVSWIMQMDALQAAHLNYSVFDSNADTVVDYAPFDINGDNLIDPSDTPISSNSEKILNGKQYSGNISAPLIISNGALELMITSNSKNGPGSTVSNAGPNAHGVQSWNQIDHAK